MSGEKAKAGSGERRLSRVGEVKAIKVSSQIVPLHHLWGSREAGNRCRARGLTCAPRLPAPRHRSSARSAAECFCSSSTELAGLVRYVSQVSKSADSCVSRGAHLAASWMMPLEKPCCISDKRGCSSMNREGMYSIGVRLIVVPMLLNVLQ